MRSSVAGENSTKHPDTHITEYNSQRETLFELADLSEDDDRSASAEIACYAQILRDKGSKLQSMLTDVACWVPRVKGALQSQKQRKHRAQGPKRIHEANTRRQSSEYKNTSYASVNNHTAAVQPLWKLFSVKRPPPH